LQEHAPLFGVAVPASATARRPRRLRALLQAQPLGHELGLPLLQLSRVQPLQPLPSHAEQLLREGLEVILKAAGARESLEVRDSTCRDPQPLARHSH